MPQSSHDHNCVGKFDLSSAGRLPTLYSCGCVSLGTHYCPESIDPGGILAADCGTSHQGLIKYLPLLSILQSTLAACHSPLHILRLGHCFVDLAPAETVSCTTALCPLQTLQSFQTTETMEPQQQSLLPHGKKCDTFEI